MKQNDRAKQFMPFAALSGYEELIEEQSKQTIPSPRAPKRTCSQKSATPTDPPRPASRKLSKEP